MDDRDLTFDAIIVAGGSARRLGGADKPGEVVGGVSLLERVLLATAAARSQIVVAPPGLGSVGKAEQQWPDLLRITESPPGGGPLAAVAAGLSRSTALVVLLLAADLPFIAPAVPPLVTAARTGRPAVLVDTEGRANPLAAAWPRNQLIAALQQIGDPTDQPMRRLLLVAESPLEIHDSQGWGADCDTPEQLAAARVRAADTPPDQLTSSAPA